MNLKEIISLKNSGGVLSREHIEKVVEDTAAGHMDVVLLTDFLKSVYEQGMSLEETANLTKSMTESGYLFEWPDEWGNIIVDKHSTGGVGDKISLPLAPILAACGLKVPMIAGRGLAHTGGTLDKLESIPGFDVNLEINEFKEQVAAIGCAISGQTSEIAPADKRMYAIRDVTNTIDCLPLIVGSILSKKVAEGLKSLVLDIKVGKAAFMKTEERAHELANLIVSSGNKLGIKTHAVLTEMNAPLGYMIGNSLEIIETIETLSGNGPRDILELIHVLGGVLLISSNVVKNMEEARNKIDRCISNKSALNKFTEMIHSQRGDPRVTNHELMWDVLGIAKHVTKLVSDKSGYVENIDAMELGLISQKLGAGRIKLGDNVKPRVGIELKKKIGDFVAQGDEIARIHSEEEINNEIIEAFHSSITLVDEVPLKVSKIIKIIKSE